MGARHTMMMQGARCGMRLWWWWGEALLGGSCLPKRTRCTVAAPALPCCHSPRPRSTWAPWSSCTTSARARCNRPAEGAAARGRSEHEIDGLVNSRLRSAAIGHARELAQVQVAVPAAAAAAVAAAVAAAATAPDLTCLTPGAALHTPVAKANTYFCWSKPRTIRLGPAGPSTNTEGMSATASTRASTRAASPAGAAAACSGGS